MKYEFAMVVGRFQPYHNIHHKLLNRALELGNKVIIVLGSSHSTPTVKNPFTAIQREEMIRSCFPEEIQERLLFAHVRDYPYNENLWITEIQNIAHQYLEEISESSTPKLVLIGHFKDESSYYLKLFPQWKFEHYDSNPRESKILSATNIRELYFEIPENFKGFYSSEGAWEKIRALVPDPIVKYLWENHYNSNTYSRLKVEYNYIKKYRNDSKFVGLPFAPTFVTTDALVTCLGHVLVVRRGFHPGKGLLALPGGFLADNLTLEENALKELKEETGIKVPKRILQGSVVGQKTFDHPNRSLRGRTITQAFHLELLTSLEEGLPSVKGGDDADKAFWIPISDLRGKEDEFFEDHMSIIRSFLGF